jgi:hypothetical protein
MKISILNKIRHYLNPLHIMCRLIDMGISRKNARLFAKRYQAFYQIIL